MQRFVYAFRGIGYAIRSEANLRIQLVVAMLVFSLAAWLGLSLVDWAILILTVGFVIAVELVNTAIEKAVDLASPDHHEFAKVAKDTAAGAVLVAAISSVGIGICILGPPLMESLGL